jgi:hypothetical protein
MVKHCLYVMVKHSLYVMVKHSLYVMVKHCLYVMLPSAEPLQRLDRLRPDEQRAGGSARGGIDAARGGRDAHRARLLVAAAPGDQDSLACKFFFFFFFNTRGNEGCTEGVRIAHLHR